MEEKEQGVDSGVGGKAMLSLHSHAGCAGLPAH